MATVIDSRTARSRGLPFALLLLAACESGPSLAPVDGSQKSEVRLLGGGFCEFEGDRIPVERYILIMRLRLREGGDEIRRRAFVHLHVDPEAEGSVGADRDRVIDELYAMGVRQIRYL